MAAITTTARNIPGKLGSLALRGGSVAAGATAGALATEAINAQFPAQQLNLAGATFGIGDLAVALGGTALFLYFGRVGGAMAKVIVDNMAVGAVGGWAVNKVAQVAGWNPPFQPIFAINGSAFARSRQLYRGNVVPSSAYRSRSRTVGSGAYHINRA